MKMTMKNRWTSGYLWDYAVLTSCVVCASLSFCGFAAAQGNSSFSSYVVRSLVSAERLEKEATLQYEFIKKAAQKDGKLAPPESTQLTLIREISKKIISQAVRLNVRAARWDWEVNLIATKEANAFCMPGGKIIVFTGLINSLHLNVDELAVVIGHEVAHAVLEHTRDQLGKEALVNTLGGLASSFFGMGNLGEAIWGGGATLASLKFSRDDEYEADAFGLEIAARSGYDPRAAFTLFKKLQIGNSRIMANWLSTHPANEKRIVQMEKIITETLPFYQAFSQK